MCSWSATGPGRRSPTVASGCCPQRAGSSRPPTTRWRPPSAIPPRPCVSTSGARSTHRRRWSARSRPIIPTPSSRSACAATCPRRSTRCAVTKLDAVVGNVATLGEALAPGLSARLVATTPLGALVTDGREAVTWEDLRRTGVAIPSQPALPEFRGFLLEFAAAAVDAPTRDDTRGVDLDRLVERIGIDAFTLVPATWKPPKDAGARVAAINPAPLFPWSVVWRTASPHPLLRDLLDALRTDELRADDNSWLPSAVREELAR